MVVSNTADDNSSGRSASVSGTGTVGTSVGANRSGDLVLPTSMVAQAVVAAALTAAAAQQEDNDDQEDEDAVVDEVVDVDDDEDDGVKNIF